MTCARAGCGRAFVTMQTRGRPSMYCSRGCLLRVRNAAQRARDEQDEAREVDPTVERPPIHAAVHQLERGACARCPATEVWLYAFISEPQTAMCGRCAVLRGMQR